MTDFHVDDYGIPITLVVVDDDDAVIDISSATSKFVILRRPDSTVLERTASFVDAGTDGKLRYVLQDGDFSLPGRYRVQGRVVTAGASWSTTIHEFRVVANADAT